MSEQPTVSVLMPVYNGIDNYPQERNLHFAIGHTLDSWGASRKDRFVELCAVNDASTDRSGTALEVWKEAYAGVKVEHNETNQGPAYTMSKAAEMATGKYLIVQAVRAWYEPDALRAMADFLDEHPEIGFVYGQTQYHGKEERRYIPPPFRRQNFFKHFDSLNGFMYRREAIDAGCRYNRHIQREGVWIDVCDWDFVMQMIVNLGWDGYAMRDRLVMNYHYSGSGQMTNYLEKYRADVMANFRQRWGYGP
jgi:glycosyltransferase involved in cell wall biosynthesis